MANALRVNTNIDLNLNRLLNSAYELLAVLPPQPGVQGRFVQVDDKLYYGDSAITWAMVPTTSQLEMAPRFVGALDVSSGTISLLTPTADPRDGSQTWDAGDYGVIAVAGVLTVQPSYGSVTTEVGDMVVCIQDPAVDNASFMIVERNQKPQAIVTLTSLFPVPVAAWTTVGPGVHEATIAAAPIFAVPHSAEVRLASTGDVEVFGIRYAGTNIILTANGALPPAVAYTLAVTGV